MKLIKMGRLAVIVALQGSCAGDNRQERDEVPLPQAMPQSATTYLQFEMAYLSAGNLDAARQSLLISVKVAQSNYCTQLETVHYEQWVEEVAAVQNYYYLAMKLAPPNSEILNNYSAFLCSLWQYVPVQQQFATAAQSADYGEIADSLESNGHHFQGWRRRAGA